MKNIRLEKNPAAEEIARKFEQLVNIMFTLRSERGCPWDRSQTLQDLRQYLLEECYELLQTLDQNDEQSMREELGDVLFQIVFLTQMQQESGRFTLGDVIDRVTEKMIGRHPHVFGDGSAGSSEEALANWESRKNEEKAKLKGANRSILDGIPLHLPALLQAHMISSKVTRVGFDWETEEDVWRKLKEEIAEFSEADSREKKEEEMGDILFTIVNIARKHNINAEDALRAANQKFQTRFQSLEKRIYDKNLDFKDMSLKELDEIWNSVKRESASTSETEQDQT